MLISTSYSLHQPLSIGGQVGTSEESAPPVPDREIFPNEYKVLNNHVCGGFSIVAVVVFVIAACLEREKLALQELLRGLVCGVFHILSSTFSLACRVSSGQWWQDETPSPVCLGTTASRGSVGSLKVMQQTWGCSG